MTAITRSKQTQPTTMPTSQLLTLAHQISTNDIADMQASDPTIQTILHYLSDPSNHPITPAQLANALTLQAILNVKPMLHVMDDILWYVPADLTAPRLVVPQCQRGVLLMYAHSAPCAEHHNTRATYETLNKWHTASYDM